MNCPLWGSTLTEIDGFGTPCSSPRAGGRFRLMREAAAVIPSLTERQKAWIGFHIYSFNYNEGLLDELPSPGGELRLDQDWLDQHKIQRPSVTDRLRGFIRELERQWDSLPSESNQILPATREEIDYLLAASGSRDKREMGSCWRDAEEQGFIELHDLRTMGDAYNWGLKSFLLEGRRFLEDNLNNRLS